VQIELKEELLHRALAGERSAMDALVKGLTPIIQARVGRVLLKSGANRGPDRIRQEVLDFTQEVFLALFTDNANALRNWSPERGLSLANFVGLIAHRKALALLRRKKHNPFTEDPTADTDFDWLTAPEETNGESITLTRQVARKILKSLDDKLTPRGRELFNLLIIQDAKVEDAAKQFDMKPSAIYMWRSRLLGAVREQTRELMLESPKLEQIP